MAEEYGFFNAQGSEGNYDRTYSAEDFSDYFAKFIPNGVFVGESNELEVVAKSGRTITVKSGWASIDGHYYHLTADKDITLSLNSGAEKRTDSICCTLDVAQRKIGVIVREGTSTPRDDGSYHDLILATISVKSNQSSIPATNITDRRKDESYCGMIDPLGKLSGYVNTTDIVTNYTTNSDTKVLAASVAVALKKLIDGKQATISGAITSVLNSNLTSGKVVTTNNSGKLTVSDIGNAELANLKGLRNNVQDVLDDEVLTYRDNISSKQIDNILTPGIYGIPGIIITDLGNSALWGVMVVVRRGGSNGPWEQIVISGDFVAWRDRSGSPANWGEWKKLATEKDIDYIKWNFHTTLDTQLSATANWVIVTKENYYLTYAHVVRDDADYYVTGINKRTGSNSNQTLVFNKSVNGVQMQVQLDWREKPS